ncbi:MAG: NlpC/P60 family protein [Coprobacillus sp.]
MKKTLLSLITICSMLTVSIYTTPVMAIDFSKDESKYIKLCSSSSLTKDNKATCEEFNEYLSKKNANLKDEISDTKKELSQTNSDINSVSSKVNSISSQIESKSNEIDYLLSSINKVEKNISTKETEMKDRLYSMQTYYNSNTFVEFIFGASSFSDFFSRLNSVNDITSYEKELVDELTKQKEQLASQKATLLDAQASLQAQKNTQLALQDQLLDLKSSQQSEIKDNQAESNKVSAAQKKIDAALDALMAQAPSGGGGGGSYVPGSSTAGNAVAQKALTKQGSRYWWGAPGGGFGDGQGLDNPNAKYFDCSGFVAWSHRQVGIKIGRTTASGYSRSGVGISKSQLQAGDVITFSYGSGVAHIGIYIGGGSFVHAAGDGSGTRGQYANQCVKVAKLAGYWESHVYNYRRLY